MARVEVEALDLIDPASVDAFAARFLGSGRPLHILLNNAGIMATPLVEGAARVSSPSLRRITSGTFNSRLGSGRRCGRRTGRAWCACRQRGRRRTAPWTSRIRSSERRAYDKVDRVRAVERRRTRSSRLRSTRAGRRIGCGRSPAPPRGDVHTEARCDRCPRRTCLRAARDTPRVAAVRLFKNVEQGAATSVWCGASAQLEGMGGVYCEDVDVAEAVPADFAGTYGVRPWAMDAGAAERLWGEREVDGGEARGVSESRLDNPRASGYFDVCSLARSASGFPSCTPCVLAGASSHHWLHGTLPRRWGCSG